MELCYLPSKTNKINHAKRGHARYSDSVSFTLPFLRLLPPSILPSIRGRRKVASRLLPREIRERCTTTTRTTLFPRPSNRTPSSLSSLLSRSSRFFFLFCTHVRTTIAHHSRIFSFRFLLIAVEPIGLERGKKLAERIRERECYGEETSYVRRYIYIYIIKHTYRGDYTDKTIGKLIVI